mmetsp:Transcript_16619/g.45987  ORF Transcript_16619/g.45987 Transcript_16619/m.45987 type:complete len:80 (-) Transcript_16619:852-1091(-)
MPPSAVALSVAVSATGLSTVVLPTGTPVLAAAQELAQAISTGAASRVAAAEDAAEPGHGSPKGMSFGDKVLHKLRRLAS